MCGRNQETRDIHENKDLGFCFLFKSYLEGWLYEQENWGSCSQLIKQSKIDDVLQLIWAVDIFKEDFQDVEHHLVAL